MLKAGGLRRAPKVTEAKSGDYDHLIQTCMEEVTVY